MIVTLKDFSLTATPGTFAAGAITFGIDNDGPSVHEFVVLRTDDAPDALPVENGVIPEDRIDLVDEVEDIPPGTDTSLEREPRRGGLRVGVQPARALRARHVRRVHRRVNLSLFLPTPRHDAYLRLCTRNAADQRFSAS